jgi:hypothetical protein
MTGHSVTIVGDERLAAGHDGPGEHRTASTVDVVCYVRFQIATKKTVGGGHRRASSDGTVDSRKLLDHAHVVDCVELRATK